jgi:phage head-tail adaptor, putative, SPP1 family
VPALANVTADIADDPGARDRRVTILAITDAVGPSGMPGQTAATLATCWMSRADILGRERYREGQMSAAMDTQFRMGYRTDMDPELVDVAKTRRLVYQGRTYDIVAASMVGRRAGITLQCLSRVG